jgi:hypothetical protein
MSESRKLKYLEKTSPSAALSTTGPTRLDSGSNLERHGGKLATNDSSYGMAIDLTNLFVAVEVKKTATIAAILS